MTSANEFKINNYNTKKCIKKNIKINNLKTMRQFI